MSDTGAAPPEPLMRKVDCVRLRVPDLDSGLAVYHDKLGHDLIWRTDNAVGLRMPEGDTEIVLHTERDEPEIDLLVKSADEAALRMAEAGGTVLVPPFDIQIGRCTVVEDPWGNRLVLLDLSKGPLVTDSSGNVVGTSSSGRTARSRKRIR